MRRNRSPLKSPLPLFYYRATLLKCNTVHFVVSRNSSRKRKKKQIKGVQIRLGIEISGFAAYYNKNMVIKRAVEWHEYDNWRVSVAITNSPILRKYSRFLVKFALNLYFYFHKSYSLDDYLSPFCFKFVKKWPYAFILDDIHQDLRLSGIVKPAAFF